jgi:hypothetical protein
VRLTREGEAIRAAPRSALTDEARSLIRAHKAELLAALTLGSCDHLLDAAVEARRQRALEMLADHPTARYALVTDLESDPQAVIAALAIRGRATCELRIPRDKYDGLLLLDLIERHGGTMH